MTIHLKPEAEALVRSSLDRGGYASAEEFVARAIELLHDQERWFSESRAEIEAKIEHGFAQGEQGELIDGDEVANTLRERRLARQKHS